MRFKAICLIICSCLVIGRFAGAETIEICGELRQGELILLRNVSAGTIAVANNPDKKNYKTDKNGTVLLALHRDAPKTVTFDVLSGSDYMSHYEVDVASGGWDIQKINGVEQSKVTPTSEADLKEIKRERQELGRALNISSGNDDWKNGFIVPIDGKISGNFGNQRIFNGVPKSPHTGTDIAAPEGTPVKAAADGKVVLSGKDYFYTGNMVVIDHGRGLQTIYAHLKQAQVQEGDFVKQGDIVGLVGRTGRATGAHLHWGASLNNVRFRPHSLLDINSKKCQKINGKRMGEDAEDE